MRMNFSFDSANPRLGKRKAESGDRCSLAFQEEELLNLYHRKGFRRQAARVEMAGCRDVVVKES